VVFAYHTVGVRGLAALLACGFDVSLVVTHEDAADENIWFESVLELARLNDIPVITPANPNMPAVVQQITQIQPEWLFSFYYRHLLGAELLAIPERGAWNLHGSLLPKYRGRVPINWAVLNGESQTGASLHRMVDKPDAGNLVDQQAVPILPNDTADVVFHKVVVAAEMVLMRSLPKMRDGTHAEQPLDLAQGSYYGGRRPEDGCIDWRQPAWNIHNLIRAVAPPYPGAYFDDRGQHFRVLGSYWRNEEAKADRLRLYWEAGRCYVDCVDGRRLQILELEHNGISLDARAFTEITGSDERDLGA
jgi:methionyl-tRNA formyltransferase